VTFQRWREAAKRRFGGNREVKHPTQAKPE
jgi:hypothetical protein